MGAAALQAWLQVRVLVNNRDGVATAKLSENDLCNVILTSRHFLKNGVALSQVIGKNVYNHLSIAGVLIKHLMKQFFWLHILQHLWPGTEKPGFMLRNLALSFGEGVWCWVLWMMVSTKGVSINLWIPNHLISGKGSRWGPRQPLQEVRQECHWWGLPQFGCVAESWQCEEHSECGAWFACLVW